MELYQVVDERCCDINFRAKNKSEALAKLAVLAKKSPVLKDIPLEEVEATLTNRERQGSTGFGETIAIPHGKIEKMDNFVCFLAIADGGVSFDAMDKKKSKIFVVLLGPTNVHAVETHLKLLSSISTTLSKKSTRKELKTSPSNSALVEAFLKHSSITDDHQKRSTKLKLMQIILYAKEYLYDILEVFIEEDIEGASVVDSFGMGEYISSIPLFADFIGFMRENKNQSKTITALIPENKVKRVVQRVEGITGDLSKKQGAVIIVQGVDFVKGTMKIL